MTTLKDIAAANSPVNWGLIKSNPSKFWKTFGWVAPVVGLGLIWVMTRIMTVLPKILGDEYIYSMNARHTPLADSSVPNYFFNIIFSSTSAFGYGFYTAAKVYNLFFLLLLSAVVYFAARLIAKPGVSFVVALLALVGPISAYASYFTPEMMFYFGCALVIYFSLRFHARTGLGKWALLGVGLGLVTLVKPHALFLAAPIFAYIIYLAFKGEGNRWLNAPVRALAFVAAMFATKFAIGYAFAGQKGLAIFGGSYDASATSAINSGGKAIGDATTDPAVAAIASGGAVGTTIWQVLFHISFMLMFLAVPLILTGIQTVRAFKAKGEPSETTKVSFFLFVALIALVLVSAVFVAYSSAFGETLQNRVMVRYYEYLIPFLPLTLLPLGNHIAKLSNVAKWLILAGSVAWVSVALPNMTQYVPALFTDSALMASAIKSGIPLAIFAALGIGMLAYWLFKPEVGAQVWLYGFAPLIVVIYAISSYANMTVPSSIVGNYTQSSRYAHDHLSADDKKNSMIIGTEPQTTQAAQLWLDEPTSQRLILAEGSAYDINTLPEKVKYIIRVGAINLVGDGIVVKQSDTKNEATGLASWYIIKNSTAERIKAGLDK
jgi:phosphoglycerol transferase